MRDITLCHPRLQALAVKLLSECAKVNLTIAIGETYRTVAEQDALYAQGRTTAGNIVTNTKGSTYSSYHQWGTAFDFYRNDGKGAYYDNDGFFTTVGTIGKQLGLEWGGDWTSPVDKPHFQLADWGSSTSGIKKLYSTPVEFMKTWKTYVVGWNQDNNGYWYADSETSYLSNCWKVINGHKYYFNSDGYAVTDWQNIFGDWYYFEPTKGSQLECALYVTDSNGKQTIGNF